MRRSEGEIGREGEERGGRVDRSEDEVRREGCEEERMHERMK